MASFNTPPLAFTPDGESSPSNAPSQHEYVPIAPSTAASVTSSLANPTAVPPSLSGMSSLVGSQGPGSAAGSVFGQQPSVFGQPAIGQPLPQIPGATVYTPTAIPSAELNPRSCVTCRRRKVRCDKHMPCSNCRRALIPCVFPAPERAPRRPRRKDPNAPLRPHQSSERELELLKRLRKLEGIVEELSGIVDTDATGNKQHPQHPLHNQTTLSNSASPEAAHGLAISTMNGGGSSSSLTAKANGTGFDGNYNVGIGGTNQPSPGLALGPATVNGSPSRVLDESGTPKTSTIKETERLYGRLVINNNGRSRYVSSAFWSRISDELDALRAEAERISEPESDNESDLGSSPQDAASTADERTAADHHAFLFGFQSSAVDLKQLHPMPSQIPYMWQVYLENVDPVVKVLHTPTTQKLVRNARINLADISPAAEALMFAIYYAAVSSLEEHEIKINFMAEKEVLVNKYRFGLEQALAKAQFLVSSDIIVLQAFVLYVVLIRRNDEIRLAWSLTGLAIRIGHSIGLHRDGTNFPGLKPFEIEMRRRLFWGLCIIDMRSAEDLGTDLYITDEGVDTQLPLNINDSDISPASETLPEPRQGTADITFALLRYEILSVARRLHVMNVGIVPTSHSDSEGITKTTAALLEERAHMIHDVYCHVWQKYLSTGDASTDPIFWVAGTIARLICAKILLVNYQPILLQMPGHDEDEMAMSNELRDRLFMVATETFEYSHILTTDPRTKQWRWLFKTYIQWHAVAYILMEEARRPWSASVERSWQALSSIIQVPKLSHEMEKMSDNASIWMPFKMLYNKARRHREAEIQRLRASRDEVVRLDRADRDRLAPAIFAIDEGGVDGSQWRARWLELVGASDLLASEARSATGSPVPSSGAVSTAGSPGETPNISGNHPNCDESEGAKNGNAVSHIGNGIQTAADIRDTVLDQVFAAPIFTSSDLFPVYLNDDLKDLQGTASDLGSMDHNGMPRQDQALANFATGRMQTNDQANGQDSNNSPSIPGPLSRQSTAPSTTQATPLVDAMIKDYPPPWLWNNSLTADMPIVPEQAQSQIPSHPQTHPHPQFTNLLVDDGDIKMDDNFDWQDFGQNLGGMSNGVWGSHGL